MKYVVCKVLVRERLVRVVFEARPSPRDPIPVGSRLLHERFSLVREVFLLRPFPMLSKARLSMLQPVDKKKT